MIAIIEKHDKSHNPGQGDYELQNNIRRKNQLPLITPED